MMFRSLLLGLLSAPALLAADLVPKKITLKPADRAAVAKVKYLYYL